MKNYEILVLNADRWTPIYIWHWTKGMRKVYTEGKKGVDVVDYYDNVYIRDGQQNLYQLPCIVASRKYVNLHGKATYSKQNVIYRDECICQYCGKEEHFRQLTIDHVVPRSHWNKNRFSYECSSFENTVACCEKCNFKKRNRTPQKAGMELIRKPRVVTREQAYNNKLRLKKIPNKWKTYIHHEKKNNPKE